MIASECVVAGRVCSKCKTYKTQEHFHRDPKAKSGLSCRCKVCDTARQMAYRMKMRALVAVNGVAAEKLCIGCGILRSGDEFHRCQDNYDGLAFYCKRCVRNSDLQRKFGITLADVERMHSDQDSCCAICLKQCSIAALHVDHDHTTGQVRGLLCHGCNTGIGLFLEDTDSMRRAIGYIESNKAK